MLFELKETNNKINKRLIISSDVDGINTFGFKLKRTELYELYLLLREEFDGTTDPGN